MSGQPLALRTETLGEWLPRLTAGELVTLTGAVYAVGAKGALRLRELLERGEPLPVDLTRGAFCCGTPSESREGTLTWDIGQAGEMRENTPILLDHGLRALIGRGDQPEEVISALIRNRGVYFAALGSAATFNGERVKTQQIVAFEDLGENALKRLGVLELPLVVAIDAAGGNLYHKGPERYRHRVNSPIW